MDFDSSQAGLNRYESRIGRSLSGTVKSQRHDTTKRRFCLRTLRQLIATWPTRTLVQIIHTSESGRKKRASTSRLFVAEKLTTTRARGGASSSSSPVRQERKENSCFKKILIDGMAVASLYLVWRGTVIYDILYQMKTATSKSSKRRLTGLADIENRVDYHQPYPIPFQSTGVSSQL
ncbi:hypothetical protein KCV06_g553, partial [Aureobasidium melanogenum]